MELKLRAWDGEEFLYSEDCNSLREFFDRTEEGGSFKTAYQLFTGLRDKNNKEIFEGDILYSFDSGEECNPYYGETEIIIKVFWSKNTADFRAGFYPLFDCTDTSEIIGNIFENPEIMSDTLPNNEPDLSIER